MPQTKHQAVTIRDVARLAGLSIATVSRYINHTLPVSDQAAQQVIAAMEELNFVPSSAARKLASMRTYTLGMVIADMRSDFFGPMLHGIEDVASQSGYDLLISSSRRAMRPGSFPLGPNNTDGLLVFSDGLDDQVLEHFTKQGFPIVLIHRTPPDGLQIPNVTVENITASQKIVEHLIEIHDRRRIVFLRGPKSQSDSYEREAGYCNALAAYKIAFDPELIAVGEFNRMVAQASIRELMHKGIQFDAVFSGDDEAAIGVLAALHQAGKKIPEDVSVVGFDDQSMSAYLNPPLTTVQAPTTQVGRFAAEKLLQLIHAGTTEQSTIFPTEIVFRRSCGCGVSPA